MLQEYIPIALILGIAVLLGGGILAMSAMLGPRKADPAKSAPYECGMPPVGDARVRFSVKFYIIAMLFILFDIEVVFMYPWAIIYRRLGLFGFYEMLVFVVILFIGYIYVLKKGALRWE